MGRGAQDDSYLGAQFRRFQRRFGRKAEGKAIFACAHTLVVMIWHVLAAADAVYEDLGADWFEQRSDTVAHTRRSSANSNGSATASTSKQQPDHHPSGPRDVGAAPRPAYACPDLP